MKSTRAPRATRDARTSAASSEGGDRQGDAASRRPPQGVGAGSRRRLMDRHLGALPMRSLSAGSLGQSPADPVSPEDEEFTTFGTLLPGYHQMNHQQPGRGDQQVTSDEPRLCLEPAGGCATTTHMLPDEFPITRAQRSTAPARPWWELQEQGEHEEEHEWDMQEASASWSQGAADSGDATSKVEERSKCDDSEDRQTAKVEVSSSLNDDKNIQPESGNAQTEHPASGRAFFDAALKEIRAEREAREKQNTWLCVLQKYLGNLLEDMQQASARDEELNNSMATTMMSTRTRAWTNVD